MSRTKGVRILGRLVWVFDNSHDVVLARMAEATDAIPGIDEETLYEWRVCASVRDFGYHCEVVPEAVFPVIDAARRAIERHGDVQRSDLVGWSVLEGIEVSNGSLRSDVLPVDALLDTLDGFRDMFAGELAPDPPGGWWFLGVPGGRTTIPRRAD